MAIYNLPNYKDEQGFGLPLNIRRGNPNPLDNSSVWGSFLEASNYAKTSGIAYVGQILTVVEDKIIKEIVDEVEVEKIIKTATAYVIDNEDGELKEVGSKVISDETTITVAEDGTISLANLPGEDGTYSAVFTDGVLTWKLVDNQEVLSAIADLEESVAGQIAEAVAALVNEAPEAYDTLKEISDWIAAHPESVAELNTSIKANADAITELAEIVGDIDVAGEIAAALTDYVKASDVEIVHAQIGSNATAIQNLTNRLDGIIASGGEPNTINTIKVNDVVQTIADDKSVNIVVPTKTSELVDDTFGTLIDQINNLVSENANAIGTIQNDIADLPGLKTTVNDHDNSISALEQKLNNYDSIVEMVNSHNTSITDLVKTTNSHTEALNVLTGVAETLTNTTIPGLQAIVANKADADTVYTKTQIDEIIGTLPENNTIVGLIEKSIYNDAAIKELIATERQRIDNILVNTDETALNSIAELADWVNTHGAKAEGMVASITKNTEDITTLTSRIDNLAIKVDNNTIKTNDNGEIYVNQISTDSFTQGEMTLVLNGGSAATE